jgi:hypothetical protein
MSGLWSDIAEVKMNVSDAKSGKTDLLKLQFTASTFSSWDSYFKVRDSYQSWVNPVTVEPLLYIRDVSEGSYTNNTKYIYKRKSLIAKSTRQRNGNKEEKKEIKITPNTLDLTSVIYYVRNLDFAGAKIGQTYDLTILVDNKLMKVTAKYKGVSDIKVSDYGTKSCYKVGLYLKDQAKLKNSETNNIWFTADSNKVPVLIKAIIPVGSIQIRLVEMKGLRS